MIVNCSLSDLRVRAQRAAAAERQSDADAAACCRPFRGPSLCGGGGGGGGVVVVVVVVVCLFVCLFRYKSNAYRPTKGNCRKMLTDAKSCMQTCTQTRNRFRLC